MLRGTTIDNRPAAPPVAPAAMVELPDVAVPHMPDRLLDTAAANAFLGRKKGFLEKRRSSGIDSPVYIQRVERGRVLYRVSDLLAWEEERMLTASSDHEGRARRPG